MTSRRQSVKEKEKDDEKTTDDKETCVRVQGGLGCGTYVRVPVLVFGG